MWHRRDVLRSGATCLVLGAAYGRASAAGVFRQPGRPALDEAAEALCAIAPHGGALDALLNGRRDLYAVARDQLGAAHDALMSVTDAPGRSRSPEEAEGCRPVLRGLAAAARRQAEWLDQVVRHDIGAPTGRAGPSLDPPAPGAFRAAQAWRETCGPDAGIEMILAGPLACVLDTARFCSRRDARGRHAVLDVYAVWFEAVLERVDAGSGPEFVPATRARAAAAETLGHVRSVRSAPVRAAALSTEALA